MQSSISAERSEIIAQLRKDLLPLQGFRPTSANGALDMDLGPIKNAFPNASFPLGAIHEFLCAGAEDAAATGGFVGGLLAALMRTGGATIWISSSRTPFPPALKFFGIEPDSIIFVNLKKDKDVLWAMEEALKCDGLAAVVGEIQEMSFTVSRRLQLAVEQSRVTGFILRHHAHNVNTTTCVSRWKISPLPSKLEEGMPGIGFPRWNVELLKIRNGHPGRWEIEWVGRFRHISPRITSMSQEQKKKAG